MISGAPEAIARFQADGIRVVFCTNNSQSTIAQYVDKIGSFGVDVGPDDIVTSAVVTGERLATRAGATAIVVGGDGVREALTDVGITINDDPESTSADLVVVGWDPSFDYAAMRRATTAVRAGAQLVATNRDATFPSPDGLWPGGGAILASIETASGAQAEVMGKPHQPMMDSIATRFDGARRVAIVGDRPDTDLAGGRARGWTTILVLSGVTTATEATALDPPPDLIVGSLADLDLSQKRGIGS